VPTVSTVTLPAAGHSILGAARDTRRTQMIAAGVVVVLVAGVALTGAFSVGPFVVTGVADGAIYALAALGLVLTYKTSGIFNFAIGAQAAASAYVFYSLRVSAGLPWPLAALFSMLLVGLLGSVLLERMAFWLTAAPAAMKVVATIGLIVLLESGLTALYGAPTIQFAPFLPNKGIHLFGVNVLGAQIVEVAIAVVATVGLYIYFRRARMGVAMQAVVDSPTLLALEATNPVAVRRYAWAIGSCFISISGMLLAPTLGIDVNLFLLIYIAAFGAAAVGSFSSLPITFAAAMGIGVTMSILSDKLAGQTNLVLAELYTQIPFLVLVAALLLVPRARLVARGSTTVRKLRPPVTLSPRMLGAGSVAGVGLAIAIPFIVGSVYVNQYTTGIGFAVVLASLGLLLWTSGQISLCQMSFAAVGASTFGHALGAGWPWLAALLAAVGVAVAVGAVAAIPSFRLSGVYLAVATFGFGLLVQNLIFPTFLMFGQVDSVTVNRPHLFGLSLASDRAYYFLALIVAALCAGVVIGVRRSRLGRLLRGLSDSAAALEAHGTDTRVTRLYVFCISAGLAAVGGVLIAGVTQHAGGTAAGPFGYFNSVVLLAILAFSGSQPLVSPIIAAFTFAVLRVYRPFNGSWFAKYEGVFFGALAIAVAVAPGITWPAFGRRAAEREGRSPVSARGRVTLGARRTGALEAGS
jgi:branched-subunit amino acid ABC-type transport system permease component